MTLVMGLATDKFIVFAADRRRTSVKDEKEFYDDMRKHFRVNHQVIIGFSGDYNITVKCIDHLKGQSLKKATVQAVASNIKRFLREELKKDNETQQTVIVGGIGDGNKIALIEMNHRDEFKPVKVVPGKSHFKWRLTYAYNNPEPIIEQEIQNINEAGEFLSIERVIEMVDRCVKYVSEHDKYVSVSYDIDFIKL